MSIYTAFYKDLTKDTIAWQAGNVERTATTRKKNTFSTKRAELPEELNETIRLRILPWHSVDESQKLIRTLSFHS